MNYAHLPQPTTPPATPKVSILIPVFDGKKFLADCLDSVLAQDFEDMEILIADDGSTDGSLEVIKEYSDRDRRIRWWQNPHNLGLTQNANCCLKEARGEYIKFVFQDDVLLSAGTVRKMAAILEKNPGVALVASTARIIDDQSKVIEQRNRLGQSGETDGQGVIVKCFEQNGNLIGEPSLALFRRKQAIRGFDVQYQQLMDLEMWFHLLEQGRLYWIAEELAAFRQHPAQQTAANRKTARGDREALTLLEEYFQKPWLKSVYTQKMLHEQSRFLKRKHGKSAEKLIREMRQSLRPGMPLLFWLERKVVRSVKKRAAKISCWLGS